MDAFNTLSALCEQLHHCQNKNQTNPCHKVPYVQETLVKDSIEQQILLNLLSI